MSLNRITLDGRLCHDPELLQARNGVPVVNFTLAVDRDYKDKNTGERGVDLIDLQAYRTNAEFICGHFGEWDQIIIDGRLQVNSWIDKYGENRMKVIVLVERIYFGQRKRDDRQKGNEPNDYYTVSQGAEDDGTPPF